MNKQYTIADMLADAKEIARRQRITYGQPVGRSGFANPAKAGMAGGLSTARRRNSPTGDKVQKCLSNIKWRTTQQIAKDAGISYGRAKSALACLKHYCIAEHKKDGKLAVWRLAK